MKIKILHECVVSEDGWTTKRLKVGEVHDIPYMIAIRRVMEGKAEVVMSNKTREEKFAEYMKDRYGMVTNPETYNQLGEPL